MKKFVLLSIFSLTIFAQKPRSVSLAWNDANNPVGTTYSVYRFEGACATGITFTKIGDAPEKTYTDLNVTTGKRYCYVVTAVLNTEESDYSNQALAVVKPFPPTEVVAK